MNKKKFLTFSILMILVLNLCILFMPNVSAYSTETTGLGTKGFDTSQETYAKIGTHNVFVFDNKLVDYSDNAVLLGTLDFPAWNNVTQWHSEAYTPSLDLSTSIRKFNDTFAIIVRSMIFDDVDMTPDCSQGGWETALINLNTYTYTVIYSRQSSSSYIQVGDIVGGLYWGTSAKLIVNENSTGKFFYDYVSFESKTSGSVVANKEYVNYIGKIVTDVWTSSYAQKYYRTTASGSNAYLKGCALIIDSNEFSDDMPDNYFYVVTSNNWQGGNRPNIYLYDIALSTMSYVGTASLDDTYGGKTTGGKSGFIYLGGIDSSTEDYLLNLVYGYSLDSGDGLGICTLRFNSSYVEQYFFTESMVSDSTVIRPFTIAKGNNIYPSAGTWSFGYFADIYTTNKEDLIGWDIAWSDVYGWEDANFHGYIWTPNNPQEFPSSYVAGINYGGFQPFESNIGLFVDMANGKCVANYMDIRSNIVEMNVYLSGGAFTNPTLINIHPVDYELNVNTQYQLTAYFYNNLGYGVSGELTIRTSALSIYSTVFGIPLTVGSDETLTNVNFNSSTSFAISPRISAVTVYQRIILNYTTTDGVSDSKQFDFIFLSGSGTNEGGTGGTGTDGTDGGLNNPDTNLGFQFFSIYTLVGLIFPIVLGLVFGAFSGKDGLLAGVIVGLLIATISGLFPIWTIIVIVIIGIGWIIGRTGIVGNTG